MSKVVVPGPGNSISRRIENTATNYKNQKPHRISVKCKEDYNYTYHMIFQYLKNSWKIFENLNVWTGRITRLL